MSQAQTQSPKTPDGLARLSNELRVWIVEMLMEAKSGHPGTPMAMAPVAYTLWNEVLRYDPVADTITVVGSLPDVPTFIEQGLADFEAVSWVGIMAPAKTPAAQE